MHRRSFRLDHQGGARDSSGRGNLQQFILVPMSERMGETFPEVMNRNSQFVQLVESFNPSRTVITVWTYPDSFRQFREIKRWLFDRGFACAAPSAAAWPAPLADLRGEVDRQPNRHETDSKSGTVELELLTINPRSAHRRLAPASAVPLTSALLTGG